MPKSDDPVGQSRNPSIEKLRELFSTERFRDWYQKRQYRRNIENGQSYFNGPGQVPNPERHSPSQLLQCHRKIAYRQRNAPAEKPDPEGIFWFGTRFEEDIAFPFLQRSVTGPDQYVCNSIWIDLVVETDVGELRLRGATDPVIVDHDAQPILPTEIKTKSSVQNLQSPNDHHKAQLHAYMIGLSDKYDIDLSEGVLMYGGRNSLNVRFFIVEFDPRFWEETVIEWATTHTDYRINDELPPANPMNDWECEFCSYRNRCGRGDTLFEDVDPIGLLPRFADYPREKLCEYLDSFDEAKLTPTLAHIYPDLANEYGVYQWHCTECSGTFAWSDVTWYSESTVPPKCPAAIIRGMMVGYVDQPRNISASSGRVTMTNNPGPDPGDHTNPLENSPGACPTCGETKYENIPGISSPVCLECGVVIETKADIPTLSGKTEAKENPVAETWDTFCSITNSTEQQVAAGLKHVETLADAVELPAEARRQAALVFGSAARNNLTDGRTTLLTVAAALCIGSREAGTPRPSELIAEAADLDATRVKRMIRTFQEELDRGYVRLSPSDYVPYLCNEAGLSGEVARQASQLISETKAGRQTSGAHPSGIAAAAIYHTSDGEVTQRDLAAVAGVTKETIRLRLKEIRGASTK